MGDDAVLFAETVDDVVEVFGVGGVAGIAFPKTLHIFPLYSGEVFVQLVEEVIPLPISTRPTSNYQFEAPSKGGCR